MLVSNVNSSVNQFWYVILVLSKILEVILQERDTKDKTVSVGTQGLST